MRTDMQSAIYTKKNQSGVALIQILIIVAILTTVALYISKSAKQQVQMAQWALERSQATVNAHSAKAEVLFELLTNKTSSNKVMSKLVYQADNNSEEQKTLNVTAQSENEAPTEPAVPWNLYNKAFSLTENVSVQLQDQAGLINLHYPQSKMLIQRLEHAGIGRQQSLIAEATLLDWQDNDNIRRINGNETGIYIRNGLLPDIRELLLQNTLSVAELKQVSSDFTIYGHGHLNLMTSSRALLTALSNKNVAEEIIKRRNLGQMSTLQVSQMMGLSDGLELHFTPSNIIAITISARFGEANVKQQMVVKFSPHTQGIKSPYNIMQTTGG